MTVRQILVGVLVGSTVIGMASHRLWKAKEFRAGISHSPNLIPHLARTQKIAFKKGSPSKNQKHRKSSETQLSSVTLYGR